jgi:hypothetical protein
VRERQLAERAECAGPVDLGGLEDLGWLALQSGEHDQHHERGPLPDEDDDDRSQRIARDELDGVHAESLHDPVDDAVEAAEHLVLPDQTGDDGHDQERRDQQRAGDALPEELAVEQDGEQRAEDEGDEHG